jgi:hypothetical protein
MDVEGALLFQAMLIVHRLNFMVMTREIRLNDGKFFIKSLKQSSNDNAFHAELSLDDPSRITVSRY